MDRAERDLHDVAAQRRKAATIADPKAREFLRKADPILARLMDARPDFHPRAWMAELPPLDAFETLIFPRALTHLALISAAFNLDRALG